MAINAFGTIYVQLNKPTFSPGEQVDGTIFLNVMSNFPGSNQLVLTISGMEMTRLIERKTRTYTSGYGKNRTTRTQVYYVTHTDYNTFFNHKFVLHQFTTPYVPAGQYTFPLSFLLQQGLPSTFNYEFHKHGNCYARVNYQIGACISSRQNTFTNIQSQHPFIVNQEQIMTSGLQKKVMNKKIVSWCCLDRGSSAITSYFEKNDYVPGEVAFVISEVDNSKGKAEILEVKGIFRQRLRIQARGYSDMLEFDHQTIKMNGIKPGDCQMGEKAHRFEIPLKTSGGLLVQPTCRGKLVSNEYTLVNKLKVDACLCCDHNPACELQMTVRNPDLQPQNVWVQPSNWNPQVMGGFVAKFTTEFSQPMDMPGGSSEGLEGVPPGPNPGSPYMNQPGMPPGPQQSYPAMPPGPQGNYPAMPPGPQGNYPAMPPGPGMPGLPHGPTNYPDA
jgi:hypothetical protein